MGGWAAQLKSDHYEKMLPMNRRLWWIVLVVFALLAFGLGIVIAFQPFTRVGMSLRSSSPAARPGIQIEELTSAEELLATAGIKAVVLKYSGGDVEFWIEIESQGKKTKEGSFGPTHVENVKPAGPNQIVEGYYLLLRTPDDVPGRETWRMAYQRDLVADQPSRVQVSTPVIQMNASQAGRQSHKESSVKALQLWEDANTERAETTVNSIRSPLPPGETVSVAEIKGKQKKGGQFTEVFKIRVMCKAVSEKEGAVDNEKTAK
jgi:hypothetical protein